MPGPRNEPPGASEQRALRVALLVYRGNPRVGGQGVYVRHLSRELSALGHEVTVFSGQPYPELAEGVALVRLPSLDLYRDSDAFRVPARREIQSPLDVLELASMWSGRFPEPRTFSLRARAALLRRRGAFDLVHDDQCLGTGLLGMRRDGWPVLASIHHPVTIDLSLELAQEQTASRRRALLRWYGFSAMQARVARQLERVITVSHSSANDIVAEMGVARERLAVVPVGVDESVYRPMPEVARIPGRIMTTASADVPLKGLVPLLEALAKVRVEEERAHLVVVGRLRPESPTAAVIERLGLADAVHFVGGEPDRAIARRYAEASVAVVPSLYEGFSLPAIEAMACGVPLLATTGGALPEVVGDDGRSALLVAPGDPSALAAALLRLLSSPGLRRSLGEAGRARVTERFTWRATAARTVAQYRLLLQGASRC